MKKTGFLFLAFLLLFGFVLAGCNNDDDDKEEKKDDVVFTGFTLTVTGSLPPAGEDEMYGAGLMRAVPAPGDPAGASATPVAIGVLKSGVFEFYVPNRASPLIPDNTQFATPGTYILNIATVKFPNLTVPEKVYLYMPDGGEEAGEVTYSAANKNVTVKGEDFVKIDFEL